MFHRVKSETQPSSEDINQQAENEQIEAADGEEYEYEEEQLEGQEEDIRSAREFSAQGPAAPSAQARGLGGYQRPNKPPVSQGSNFGASPYGSSPSYGVQNASGDAGDRKLTLGAGITMSGEIESCDHLIVEGTVEAALKGAKVLEVAETGTYLGTVDIENATIAGRFEGEISVSGRLTILSTGTITGSIAYKELAVEAGAVIDGKMNPLKPKNAEVGSAPEKKRILKKGNAKEAAALAKAKEIKAQKDMKLKEVANQENQMFERQPVTAAE